MKKILIMIVVLIVIAPIAYYLISPAFRVVEVHEGIPGPLIFDRMDTMTPDEKARMTQEVEMMKDDVMVMEEAIPTGPKILAQNMFKPRAHEVTGKAVLLEVDGKKIIRFEDFETINGPDLHIYLASELGNQDYIDLGKIRATKGSVNYEVPTDVDTSRYNKVLVWCEPFGVLFSYAELG